MSLVHIVISCFMVSITLVASDHVTSVQVSTIVSEKKCDTSSSKVCTGWWIFRTCSNEYFWNCYVIYREEQIEKKICQTGWADLPNCLTPICTSCAPGQVCTGPETCSCLTTGGTCTNVPCDATLTCYPGTCTGSSCSCPPAFSGPDCTTTRETPNIKNCDITLTSGNNIVGRTSCAAYLTSPQTLWINSNGLSSIQISSVVEFKSNFPFPDVSFVEKPVKYGIAEVGYSFNEQAMPYKCLQLFENYATCLKEIKISDLGLPILHGSGFEISTFAKIGGFKTGSKNGVIYSSFPQTYFNGSSIARNASIKFDNNPPTHCLSNPTADCPTFPIYLAEDITSNPTVQAEIQRWEDPDSGIYQYYIEVHLLQKGQNGLANVGSPIWYTYLKPDHHVFTFNLNKAGVYAIELTVSDQANNQAKARNIMIFTEGGNLKTDETKEIKIEELQKTDKTSKVWWVTNAVYLKKKYFILSWTDYFVSQSKFNDDWSLPVEPLYWGIDDLGSYKNCYGQRNISQFNGLKNGISNYKVSCYVDNEYGGSTLNFSKSQNYDSSVNNVKLNYTEDIKDGGTLAIELSCTDVVGAQITEHLFIYVDTSPPRVTNFTFFTNNPDIYTSRVNFRIEEKDSGIKEINFNLYDGINKNPFKTGTVQPKLRDPPNTNSKTKRDTVEGECTTDDSTCYCATLGKCYNYIQTIEIDHCWLDRMNIENLQIGITVVNNAGVSSSEKDVPLSNFKGLSCRPVSSLQAGQIAAIVICVIIFFIILFLIALLLLRIYWFKRPVPMPQMMRDKIKQFRAGPVMTENVAYVSNNQLPPAYDQINDHIDVSFNNHDIKIYDSLKDKPMEFEIDNLNFEKILSQGALMIVKLAIPKSGKFKNISVAVKSLKSGANLEERRFMDEKVNFFVNLKPHENIVNAVGFVPGPKEKMIVMEYCQKPLLDWLKNLQHLTPETLGDMKSFALDISKGVEYLHENDIIHKRLSASNVLLMKRNNVNVAKLIGFGPKMEVENGKVPTKWLAPETLESIDDPSPFYSEKTDAWSFGILLWEIYTKGKKPYSDISSREALVLIVKGKKMKKPDDCPDDMYDDVMAKCWSTEPDERPNFNEISVKITGGKPGYYSTRGLLGGGGGGGGSSGGGGGMRVKVMGI